MMKDILLVGDSQTYDVAVNTKRGFTIQGLNQGGWTVNQLKTAFDNYSRFFKHDQIIIICIGTNGVFGSNSVGMLDDVDGLVKSIINHCDGYPRIAVIQGSWGWYPTQSNIKDVVHNYYYDRFYKSNKVAVIEPPIGYSKTHPDSNTPTVKKIASFIDVIDKI